MINYNENIQNFVWNLYKLKPISLYLIIINFFGTII